MQDEKPPYFFFWFLGFFIVFCFIVIVYGFAQKQSATFDLPQEPQEVIETVAVENQQTYL